MNTTASGKSKSSKRLKSALVIVMAILLALSGTFAVVFATQQGEGGIGQQTPKTTNPGGRVHDDFKYISSQAGQHDRNIYAESYTDENNDGNFVYARIQLHEYFEHGVYAGKPDTTKNKSVTRIPSNAKMGDVAKYQMVDYANIASSPLNTYRDLTFGHQDLTPADDSDSSFANASTVFMPTFNKTTSGADADDIDQRGELFNNSTTYTSYAAGNALEDTASYSDGTANNYILETHKAKATQDSKGVLTIDEWKAKYQAWVDGGETGTPDIYNYWVWCPGTTAADSWFYWSSPIAAEEATGLLVDDVQVNYTVQDWWYSLDVKGEFVTPNEFAVDNPDTPAAWYWQNSGGTAQAITQDTYDMLNASWDNSYPGKLQQAIASADSVVDLIDAGKTARSDFASAIVNVSTTNVGSNVPYDEASGNGDVAVQNYYVIEKRADGTALLLSQYFAPNWYSTANQRGSFDRDNWTPGHKVSTSWIGSYAENWCNTVCFDDFDPGLQKLIRTTEIKTQQDLAAFGANLTSNSKVFFLAAADISEAPSGYSDFSTSWGKQLHTAIIKSGDFNSYNDYSRGAWWWTRSPYSTLNGKMVANVSSGGKFDAGVAPAGPSTGTNGGARPAFNLVYKYQ